VSVERVMQLQASARLLHKTSGRLLRRTSRRRVCPVAKPRFPPACHELIALFFERQYAVCQAQELSTCLESKPRFPPSRLPLAWKPPWSMRLLAEGATAI
jgi:hypothetical protein